MATQYIEDPTTKERIPFEWDKSTPPTSEDIDALFKAVSGGGQDDPNIIKRSVGRRVSNTVMNIPGSALNVAKGMIQTVTHPTETLKGVGSLVRGGIETGLAPLMPGKVEPSPKAAAFQKGIMNPLVEYAKDPSKLLDYVENDPVGAAMNLSMVLGIAGKGAELGGLARTANALAKTSEYTNPVTQASRPLRWAAGKPINALAREASPEVQGRIQLGQETGVPLTVADVTQRKGPALLESQLEKNIGSASKAQARAGEKLAATEKFAGQVEAGMGGPTGKLEAGQIAQEASWPRYRAFQARASFLYKKIPVNSETKIPTKKLGEIALENSEELGKIDNATVKKVLKIAKETETPEKTVTSTILDKNGNPVIKETIPAGPAYRWGELLDDQSTLKKMAARATDRNQKRIYNELADAINSDISEYSKQVKDPKVKALYDQAVKFYREGNSKLPGIRVWNDRQIMNMMRSSSPEDIVNNFIKAKPNVSDIKRLKQVAGDKGFRPIKQAWFEDMITQGEDQSFSYRKYVSSYDRYKRGGNLDEMLTPTERKGTDKLYEISRIIDSAEKLAGNPSGTAQNVIQDAYRWVKHPIISAVTQLFANRFADLYFNNPRFQSFLIEGLKEGSTSRKALFIAREIERMAASSKGTQTLYQAGRAGEAGNQ